MCNAMNHPPGCQCGWGQGPGGITGQVNRLTFKEAWEGFPSAKASITCITKCWWCGSPVFFHRNANGGCVLFDELGAPWQVHPCWEMYRVPSDQRWWDLPRRSLKALGYDGRSYRMASELVVVPGTTLENVSLAGFVMRIPGGQGGHLGTIEVVTSGSKMYRLIVRSSVNSLLNEFDVVGLRASWRRHSGVWILLVSEIHRMTASGREAIMSVDAPGDSCSVCGLDLDQEKDWGINPEFKPNCAKCSKVSDVVVLRRQVALILSGTTQKGKTSKQKEYAYCDLCVPKVKIRKSKLSRHINNVHGKAKERLTGEGDSLSPMKGSEKIGSKAEAQKKCPYCQESFPANQLRGHLRRHVR